MNALDLLREVGWSGAADIALMSVLAYLALTWLQQSRTRNVLRAVLVVLPVYLAARLFDLRLVGMVLEAAFLVVLVAAIVLYGDEIRRIIERTASLVRRKEKPTAREDLAVIARTAFDLAEERLGALVLLEGQEPIDSLLEGGVVLDGVVSEPLLKSLFDKGSMGHDGAFVVRGGRAYRFACHLPLSTNFEALGHRGTRHAAALGISERSDSLCIAVSEEHGTVSVAQHGELEVVESVEQLVERLERFQRGATRQGGRPRQRLHPALMAAAVLIAAGSWVVLVHGARPVQRSYVLPVEAELASDMRVHTVHPETVTVTVTGAGRDFYLVRPSSVRVVVSLPDARPGTSVVTLGASEVVLPRGITLKSVQPGQVAVYLVKR